MPHFSVHSAKATLVLYFGLNPNCFEKKKLFSFKKMRSLRRTILSKILLRHSKIDIDLYFSMAYLSLFNVVNEKLQF